MKITNIDEDGGSDSDNSSEEVYDSEIFSDSFEGPVSTSCQVSLFSKTYKKDNKSDQNDFFKYPNSRYKYIKKLNDGSASKLYLAHDTKLNKNAIIKKISKKESWREELNILQTIKNIRSANVLKENNDKLLNYVDFFENHMFAYIVTEYYEDFDLFEYVEINCPYDEISGSFLIKEMAKCIKVCHDIGIVHLDIKCENYIVKKFNPSDPSSIELILIDFGHAEIIEPNTDDMIQGRFYYGTNYYLCPESEDKIYSKKSDTWSLGVCAFLILTGHYIFRGKVTDPERCYVKLDSECKYFNLSPEATDFIKYCLSFYHQDRPNIDQVLAHPFLNKNKQL
jgi:serine/threonine protein kinase